MAAQRPKEAKVLSDGAEQRRRFESSPLMRSARFAAVRVRGRRSGVPGSPHWQPPLGFLRRDEWRTGYQGQAPQNDMLRTYPPRFSSSVPSRVSADPGRHSHAAYACDYHVYKVAKPFFAWQGGIAPWFEQPGGGRQIKLDPVRAWFSAGFRPVTAAPSARMMVNTWAGNAEPNA